MSQQKDIHIGLVDDHTLFMRGLNALLADIPGMSVLFQAKDGREMVERLAEGEVPDVILLDIQMPVMDGITALQAVRKGYPSIKVLMLSMHNDDAMVIHLMELGAHGYLLKESNPEEVAMAIHAVIETGFYFNERVSRAMLKKITKSERFKPVFSGKTQLTDREVEVIALVCKGLTNPEIGDKLYVSARTVEGHRKNIMEKIGVRNTAAMIIYAIKHRWVDLEDV